MKRYRVEFKSEYVNLDATLMKIDGNSNLVFLNSTREVVFVAAKDQWIKAYEMK